MENELSDLKQECITHLYLCAENVAKYVDDDGEKQVELEKLRRCLQRYCTLDIHKDVTAEAMKKTEAETNDSNIDTFMERYQMYLKQLAEAWAQFNNHPFVLEFNRRYQTALASETMTEDSDVVINEAQSQKQYIDPYNKKPITDPVRNTLCSHYYQKDIVMDIIQRNNGSKCPVSGCGNPNYITAAHLIPDEELRCRLLNMHSTM